MSYTPTEWETGDVITAAKLNNIEDGIVANEEAIADAFVAPEVTAADQGKVLTVDSSGEWDAESLPAASYVVEAKCEINPQTFAVVSNTFQVIDGDMSEAISNYSKSVMVVHLIITGTTVEYGLLVAHPASRTFAIQGMEGTDDDVAWTTVFALPVANTIGVASINYDVSDEEFFAVFFKVSAST